MTSESDVFVGKTDMYQGVTVTSSDESCSREVFEPKLKASLAKWKDEVWQKNSLCWWHIKSYEFLFFFSLSPCIRGFGASGST